MDCDKEDKPSGKNGAQYQKFVGIFIFFRIFSEVLVIAIRGPKLGTYSDRGF